MISGLPDRFDGPRCRRRGGVLPGIDSFAIGMLFSLLLTGCAIDRRGNSASGQPTEFGRLLAAEAERDVQPDQSSDSPEAEPDDPEESDSESLSQSLEPAPAERLAELLRTEASRSNPESTPQPKVPAPVGRRSRFGQLLRQANGSDSQSEIKRAATGIKPTRLGVPPNLGESENLSEHPTELCQRTNPFAKSEPRTEQFTAAEETGAAGESDPFCVPKRLPQFEFAKSIPATQPWSGSAGVDESEPEHAVLPSASVLPSAPVQAIVQTEPVNQTESANQTEFTAPAPPAVPTSSPGSQGMLTNTPPPLETAAEPPSHSDVAANANAVSDSNVVKAARFQVGSEIVPLPLDSAPAAVLSGQAPPLSANPPQDLPPMTNPLNPAVVPCAGGSYRIEIGDQVQLKFLYRPDLNETLIVGDDGLITPAITPPICAAGKTEAMLQQALQGYISMRHYDAIANQEDHQSVDYLIAINDQIEVRFETATELNDTVTVRPDGKISLALIGEVVAEGKTPAALQNELERRYAEERKNAELVVIMREMTSPNIYRDGVAVPLPIKGIEVFTVSVVRTAPRLVYVLGEVGVPSAIPYQPNMTAIRAIGSSGGASRSANLKNAMILRRAGDCGVTQISVDLRPCRDCVTGFNSHTDGGFADVPLQPDDVIMVPKTKIAKVQDWLDQYVYDLFPPLRNSSVFSVIYNQGIPGFNNP